ncbi:MAG: NACHT domain-containing protein [Gloeotrichia echinulata CP02]
MTRRSLEASSKGISKAKAALIRHSLTQQGLSVELGISRQPVTKFFQGKPVDRSIFVTICQKLNLDWEEIITFSSFPEAEQTVSISQLESLVQTVRAQIYQNIHNKCGIMRVLDMEQPMRLTNIYTSVNILERVSGRRRLDIEELLQNIDTENLNSKPKKWFPGLAVVERYDKLMILGKPGTGKTTFLKWLAIKCNLGEWRGDRVPIFISLKEFAETKKQPGLKSYVAKQLKNCGVVEPQTVETLLNQGRVMVLLDGLDEVRAADLDRVLPEIRRFTTRFYGNYFIITSRIAAQEYIFEQFTEVEIADFNHQQITDFATKWFQVKNPVQTERFLAKIQESKTLQELATNPLMLTLMSLIFEQRSDFSVRLAEVYQEGLDIFLKKWDAQRHIQREQVYQLRPQHKEELLIKIAKTTWEQGNYLFNQKFIQQQITEYIHNLQQRNTDQELLQIDSETILKSMIAQHGLLVEQARGVYSFSHVAFQQYLAEKDITPEPLEDYRSRSVP